MSKPNIPNIHKREHIKDKTIPKGFHKTCNNCYYRHITHRTSRRESKMIVEKCPPEIRYEFRARKIAKDKTDEEFESREARVREIERLLKLKDYPRTYLAGQRADIPQGEFSIINAVGIEHEYRQKAEKYLRKQPSINQFVMAMQPCSNWRYKGHLVVDEAKSKAKGVKTNRTRTQFKNREEDYLCTECNRTFNKEKIANQDKCPYCDNRTLLKLSTKPRTVKCR